MEPEPEHEGIKSWLWKRYPLPNGRWEKRYCTLHYHILRCYMDETHHIKTRELHLHEGFKIIDISTADIADPIFPYGFGVVAANGYGKPTFFCTETEQLQQNWVLSINYALSKARDLDSLRASVRTSIRIPGFAAEALHRMQRSSQVSHREQLLDTRGHQLRGLSVQFMEAKFADEVTAAGFNLDAKVHDIEPKVIRPKGVGVICPRDGRMGAAYVDCIEDVDGAGLSTHMLSYTWNYSVGDVVEGLSLFCDKEKLVKKNVRFWICCLCINQHRVQEQSGVKPFEEFQREFESRVVGIGHVVALMLPWKEPMYIKRVWCVFEMFTAFGLGKRCSISVTMPRREDTDMHNVLTQGASHQIWAALLTVKIEEADATVESDKENIFKLLNDGYLDGAGFHILNSAVVKCLQSWIKSTCNTLLQQEMLFPDAAPEKLGKLCTSIGSIFAQIGDLQQAASVLDRGYQHLKKSKELRTRVGASLVMHIGLTRGLGGDPSSALSAFKEARLVFKHMNMLESHEGAALLAHLGKATGKMGNLKKELDYLVKAKKIRRHLGNLQSLEGALLLRYLGDAHGRNGDLKSELESYQEARQLHVATGTLQTPEGAVLMRHVGRVRGQSNDLQGEIAAYEEAKKIRERTGTLDSPGGAVLMRALGAAKGKQNDTAGELEAYEHAQYIFERTRTLETPGGLDLMNRLVATKQKLKHSISSELQDVLERVESRCCAFPCGALHQLMEEVTKDDDSKEEEMEEQELEVDAL